MSKMILVVVAFLFFGSSVKAQEDRVVDEFEIHANINDVWNAFSTAEGLRSWVAPLADIDFRVGGKWRANYNKDGELGDEATIENTILSYDPQRMISLKATGFPKGFEFVDAAKHTWTVFYFTKVSDDKTKITIVGLGYRDTEQSRKMRAFFKPANQYSMNLLKAALERTAPSEQYDN
ncbi:MAG: SRPBCC domain-containing protein [Alteromonadaceae bacterium]|nr:SRPBCC domain-containing protein [Alteromonadaceae bacterium]